MDTLPLLPRVAVTRFGTVCDLPAFRLLEPGSGVPLGKTRTSVVLVVLVTVTLRIAAVALAGTAPESVCTPATCRSIVWPGPTLACAAPVPFRVSRMRLGLTGV